MFLVIGIFLDICMHTMCLFTYPFIYIYTGGMATDKEAKFSQKLQQQQKQQSPVQVQQQQLQQQHHTQRDQQLQSQRPPRPQVLIYIFIYTNI